MKSPLSRLTSPMKEEEQNEVKKKVSSKFCLSCNKKLSNTSSIHKETIM